MKFGLLLWVEHVLLIGLGCAFSSTESARNRGKGQIKNTEYSHPERCLQVASLHVLVVASS